MRTFTLLCFVAGCAGFSTHKDTVDEKCVKDGGVVEVPGQKCFFYCDKPYVVIGGKVDLSAVVACKDACNKFMEDDWCGSPNKYCVPKNVKTEKFPDGYGEFVYDTYCI